jgi:hypothetical protein
LPASRQRFGHLPQGGFVEVDDALVFGVPWHIEAACMDIVRGVVEHWCKKLLPEARSALPS